MDRSEKSGLQRLVIRFVDPATAAAMEAHSRAWLVICPHCGFGRSIWQLGGIRYGASGRTRMLARCPQCGRTGWHRVAKAKDFPTDKARVWPILALILGFVAAGLIVTALAAGLVLTLTGLV